MSAEAPNHDVIVLDAGAIIRLARGDVRSRQRMAWLRDREYEVIAPAVVVAETVRGNGPRDAPVNLVLNAAAIVSLHDDVARIAGQLLADAGSNSTVDAIVVAHALQRRPAVIVTTDTTDLSLLLGARVGVTIESW